MFSIFKKATPSLLEEVYPVLEARELDNERTNILFSYLLTCDKTLDNPQVEIAILSKLYSSAKKPVDNNPSSIHNEIVEYAKPDAIKRVIIICDLYHKFIDSAEQRQTIQNSINFEKIQIDSSLKLVELYHFLDAKRLLEPELSIGQLYDIARIHILEKSVVDFQKLRLFGIKFNDAPLDSCELLGQGTFGSVYKHGDVAIKVITKNYIFSPKKEILQKLMIEISILGELHHRNIIGFNAAYYNHSTRKFGLVLEYGAYTLYDKIFALQSTLSIGIRLQFIKNILHGLDYLHRDKELVHGDIKPDNILVVETNVGPIAKLADFGLATRKGVDSFLGTPAYMAPELHKHHLRQPGHFGLNGSCSAASDIFSLGLTMWEIIAQEKSWLRFGSACTPNKIATRLVWKTNDRPQVEESWPDNAKKAMITCWQYFPNKRPTAETVLSNYFSDALKK